MVYKWKPSKSARREFAQKMSTDVDFANSYNQRKLEKSEKRRAQSNFDYESAGGNYVPTQFQHDFCLNNYHLFETPQERDAANIVMSSYSCNEKTHHDNIHVVNEKIRSETKN
jgi:hypothetical protein